MKKFLFLLLFLLSFVHAEDSEKKWYVQIVGGGGSNNSPSLKGSIINGRFGFEYRPIPSIGLGIGLSNNSLKLEPKEPAFIRALPYLLPSILLDGSGSSIFQSLLLYSAFESVTSSSAFVT